MVGAIKSNVDKDPGSEFSAYAKEILSSNHGYNEVSRVYSDLNVAADAPPAAPALREHDTALKMCPRIPDSVERSVDGTVWYVAHNYYISFDSSGAALYMRSPSGMIKETAPKELRDYFSERDEILTEDLPAGNLVRLRAKLSGVTREALCEIDRGLSAVLLYDFSLQTGDSVNLYREERFLLTDYRDNGMMSFYVVSTDSIEIGSIKCKRLFLSRDKNRNTPSEIWIEGIGSNTGFLESTCSYYEHLRNLLCVKQNEEVMYYNGDNTCYISVSIDDIDNTNAKIYPTLVKDNIYVVLDNNKPMDISFVNISGHIMKTIRTKGSKEIDISSLPSGIYNVIINNTHSQKIIKL